ncbi:unnamed protein product [Oppiella nova]|uniref:Uncharacterized protein n=1 Tax=Oppiella nova TaxID=334625 RepID=A0A7R9QGM5_9ACAR|nr:unnamed protein product [Oppiella nova]CAG2165351.1 unnamed protein product [Oppiella nova]
MTVIIAEISESDQLTKLDFTYQLIKHTLNRQLHLSVRRHSDSELARHIYYHVEDEDDEVECSSRRELKLLNDFLRHSDENVEKFAEFIYISDEENSDKDDECHDYECEDSIDSNSEHEINETLNESSLHYNVCYGYVHEFMSDNVLPQLIGGLETIDEEDDEDLSSASSHKYYSYACSDDSTALHQQHSEEEILSPCEDLDGNDVLIPPPDIDFGEDPESQTAFFEHIDQQSDKTSDILPLALSPDSDDSDMPAIAGPTFKAKAPKNAGSLQLDVHLHPHLIFSDKIVEKRTVRQNPILESEQTLTRTELN